MSEARLWNYIDNNIGHTGHFSRVESHATSAGIPDVDYCINGTSNHLELKFGNYRKMFKLRPTQCAWFRRRVDNGGNPWLLFRYEYKDGHIIHGILEGKRVPIMVHCKSIDQWVKASHKIWVGAPNWGELIGILSGSLHSL